MQSEFEKGLLTQQICDANRRTLSFALFTGIAFLALLLVISTSRAWILSAPSRLRKKPFWALFGLSNHTL